jgi:hypothetical protein
MKPASLIGRNMECELLEGCMEDSEAQLIVVYGRRRVGKTYLINEFFNHHFAFKVTGANGKGKSFQIQSFIEEFHRKGYEHHHELKEWREVFSVLRDYLESLPRDEKHVVFLDEMPWLDSSGSDFLPVFEWFWNDWGSTVKNLVFIVCGSATAWMVDHFDRNMGGLFNRQTCRLFLKPFTLTETEQFLLSRNIQWSRYQIAECYMIMGGIPYYLKQLNSRQTYTENIDRIFFMDHGPLWDEFDHLFRTLFANSEIYVKVVEKLSEKPGGMTRKEIAQKTKIGESGFLTIILNNLCLSGFIRISAFYGKKKKDTKYQLSDYYTAFYFRFLKDHYGKDHNFWSHANDYPSRRAWSGLTFEQLCKDHIPQIKAKLGISGVLTEESIWFTEEEPELNLPGAQVDLVIDRRDQVTHLCEMKYSINEFVIDKDYDAVLRNKLEAFRRKTKSKKTLLITMITTHGVHRNMYSNLVQSEVCLDDLFL